MSVEAPAAIAVKPGAARTARAFAIPRLDFALMLLLFTLAIIPRAAWSAYADRAPKELNDPLFYAIYSDQIADGKGYETLDGRKVAYYPVGYPATVAGLKKAGDIFGWGRSIFSVKMMNGMFGAITVLLLYLMGLRLFDRRVAVAAGLLQAVFPSQVFYGGTFLSEPEFPMLFTAAMLCLFWHPWSREGMGWGRLLSVGLLLGAATMVRGILLVFPLLLLAAWFFALRSHKRALLQAVVVFAGICVFVVPWSIRNTVVMGELTGPSTNLGDDLCIGNFNGAQGAFTLGGKCFQGYEGLSPRQVEIQRNRDGVKTAIKDVLSHPLRMPRLIGQKAYWLLYRDDDGLSASQSYGHDPFIHAYLYDVLSFAANSIYYATGAVAILGALAFAYTRDPRRPMVVLTLLYVLAIPLVFFGDPRFHYPAIPFAVLIAAATMIAIWDGRGTRLPSMERIDDLSA